MPDSAPDIEWAEESTQQPPAARVTTPERKAAAAPPKLVERARPGDEEFTPSEPLAHVPPSYAERNGRHPAAASPGRTLPHSIESEEFLLSCCLLDGADVISRCLEARIRPDSFYVAAHGIIFEHLLDLYERKLPIDVGPLAEELKTARQLDAVGGYAFLTQVSSRIPTTAQAGYYIDKVREQALLRESIRAATRAVEDAYNFSGGIDEFLAEQQARLKSVVEHGAATTRSPLRSLTDFTIPQDGDASILLGNRYLNRGDGAVLSGTSGMGKSSMSVQMATLFALGRPAFGIPPNGPLRSLIVQSEDSDGDVAEMQLSVAHALELSTVDRATVGSRVKVWTERVLRGDRFIAALRSKIEEFQPDLVWVNPLQAFIDGDVTDSQDLGRFLREGLNGLNDARFGYVIVHHTTKPATGRDKVERLWHEVMYDMAGGAEIINWARAILSLRASAKEGDFKLVLAKRGRRAGVVRLVEQGAGQRPEPVTTIPLRHAKGFVPAAQIGARKDLPLIFWEPREPDEEDAPKPKGGRPSKYQFSDYVQIFPKKGEPPLPKQQLWKLATEIKGVPESSFRDLLAVAVADGMLERHKHPTHGFVYTLGL